MAKVRMEERNINYVRNAIDMVVGETGYPAVGTTLVYSGVASRQDLRYMESKGLIRSVDVEVPSELVPGKYTQYKAYYTERNIPEFVQKHLDRTEGLTTGERMKKHLDENAKVRYAAGAITR